MGLRAEGRRAFVSYVMAGDPDPETSLAILKGLPGAAGVAIGQAMVVYPPANLDAIPDRKATDIGTELESFHEAIAAVRDDLRDYANRMSGILPSEELALFDALLLMLGGDTLVTQTVELIRQGHWAPGALRQSIRNHAQVFESMVDVFLRERATITACGR